MKRAARLKQWVRFTDATFDEGTECLLVDGKDREEVLRAMRAEYSADFADAFFAEIRTNIEKGDLAVIRIENKWRLVGAGKIEEVHVTMHRAEISRLLGSSNERDKAHLKQALNDAKACRESRRVSVAMNACDCFCCCVDREARAAGHTALVA
jgi:hypothetical protein